ncbi:hypothetical protein [Moorena sp. SIO1F2]|uniref:hypothetical protein n=1 Tax=Moorena sp. SIO1F2 TaxID=2607819 RepID=UPI0025F20280|nr:hypothetical protein [Moorena sp. SIO1F2]
MTRPRSIRNRCAIAEGRDEYSATRKAKGKRQEARGKSLLQQRFSFYKYQMC